MDKFDFGKVEKKWKDKWFKDNIYEAVDFSEKPKKYILAELPYPSGKFLHLGHMMRYTVPDIYSRYLRMKGFNVMFPMGWDSFGLPAETYAIKEGITPQEAIATATVEYKKAMQNMGYGIDWDREINTSDPEYYKWTQWTFIKLWEKGLAEMQEMPVWWCKELGVLADEEVLPAKDGKGKISERGGHPVIRKNFKQWVLRIPDFADRLIDDLDLVDYYDSVKQGQINWIGKSEGALIKFSVDDEDVEVFTTRPDTLFGVTFLAFSPEHPLVEGFLKKAKNKKEIEEYVEQAKFLSDLEKQTKEKTGVKVEGVMASNPFFENEQNIPVFIADYILADYGTGAVMGVPGHDERDEEFAQKYDVEIIKVLKETKDGEEVINSGKYDGMTSKEFKKLVVEDLDKIGKGRFSKNYKLRPQVFSRQRYWGEPIPLIHKKDGEIEAVAEKDLPLELPVMKDFMAGDDGVSPLEGNKKWVETKDSKGNSAKRDTGTMPTWAGSNWYFMRYVDPKNDKSLADMKKLKYWMPVDKYFGDAGHTTAHLLYSRFWYKFLYDEGLVPSSEPFQWRMSGGILLGANGQKMSKSKGNVVNPQDVLENYGADSVRTYLAFIGPYEDTYPWNPNGLVACARLVRNIYDLRAKVIDVESDEETLRKLHRLINRTTSMMENLKMNTAVSEIMIFINHLKKQESISEAVWKDFLKVTAPFTPFVTEELWQEINDYKKWKKENSIHLQAWPKFDEKLAANKILEIPVQINGKVRAKLAVEPGTSEKDLIKRALDNKSVANYIGNKKVQKTIYVEGKILNLVV